MTDKTDNPNQINAPSNQNQETNPVFNLLRIYLKDLSLEQPNAPEIFPELAKLEEEPKTEVNIGIDHRQLNDICYECLVKITITTKIKEKTLYLIEGHQAGIFEIRNQNAQEIDKQLGVSAARIVYTHLHANITDCITRSGMPPVYLAIIDFDHLYENRKQEALSKFSNQSNTNNLANDGSKLN